MQRQQTISNRLGPGADASQAAKVLSLVDALEDSDDVQNVFTNMDLTPDVLAALDAEDG